MTLLYPVWLLLAVPLAAGLWYWPMPTRALQIVRATTLTLVVLALAGLSVRLPSRTGTVVVVADRSFSMPGGAEQSQKEVIDLVTKAMSAGDRVAVIAFGERAAVEQPPQGGRFAGFVQDVGADGSRLGEALDKALAILPPDAPGRVLILSDGRWTGEDPARAAALAAARSVPIDYRELARASAGDVAVARIDAPANVGPGESFMVTAWIRSPVAQEVGFELRRGPRSLGKGRRAVPAGLSRLVFRDRADGPGTQQYVFTLDGPPNDPVPENNTARVLVGVDGPRPLLCITETADGGLAKLLGGGGLNIRPLRPDECDWSLEGLSNYAGVVIENVPAGKIGQRGMESMAAWVTQSGAGLMMTGGRSSYGPGGYFKSPLEPVMPVSMELRREHRKHAVAIVVALDRSGSMAAPTPSGRPKMALADLGAAQVLDLLSPMDEFGCIAVDTSSHVIVERGPVADKAAAKGRILGIESMGGGIYIYEALSSAAGIVAGAAPGTKHIILFADAADSEEPGNYKELVEKCVKADITVSVIGMGTEVDSDAELLKDIARRGKGRIFFTNNLEELPRLFAQDTFVVARSTFVDEPTAVRTTGGLPVLTGRRIDAPPPPAVGGYNLCYLRDGANLGVVTTDEYAAPVVAAWQAGLGRAVCYTGEANGQFTGAIKQWKDLGELFTSLGRWTAGGQRDLPGQMLLTQEVEGGMCVVRLHLDPERKADPITTLPRVTTLRDRGGSKPAAEKAAMRWTSADTLAVEVPLRGDETALSTVEVQGAGVVTLPPVCLPYSAEYQPGDDRRGATALRSLARATGGQERINAGAIWADLVKLPRMINLLPWLVVAAAAVFLFEVLERRTGALAAVTGWGGTLVTRRKAEAKKTAGPANPSSAARAAAPAAEKGEGPKAAGVTGGDLNSALRDARRRARGRTGGQ